MVLQFSTCLPPPGFTFTLPALYWPPRSHRTTSNIAALVAHEQVLLKERRALVVSSLPIA
jgi:hypothetical protein